MVPIISFAVLLLGFILIIYSNKDFLRTIGLALIIFSIGVGFLMIGVTLPVKTIITTPNDAFMEKNENSIVVVVPNVGNKVITDPAIINFLSKNDTICVEHNYNSYEVEMESLRRIYVKKNGYKY